MTIQWRIYPLSEEQFTADLKSSYNKWQERLKRHKEAEDEAAPNKKQKTH